MKEMQVNNDDCDGGGDDEEEEETKGYTYDMHTHISMCAFINIQIHMHTRKHRCRQTEVT